MTDESGHNLDIWGGEDTTPVLMPQSAADCTAARDGQCPPGCRACLDFAEEMRLADRADQTDQTDQRT